VNKKVLYTLIHDPPAVFSLALVEVFWVIDPTGSFLNIWKMHVRLGVLAGSST